MLRNIASAFSSTPKDMTRSAMKLPAQLIGKTSDSMVLAVVLISTANVMNFAMMAAMIGAAMRHHRPQPAAQAA